MLGSLLSMASAALFGLNSASIRRGVLTGTVVQGVAISVTVGIPIFLIAGVATNAFDVILGMGSSLLLMLALAGAIHFGFARYCNYRSLQAMGSNLTRSFQQMSLLLTLALALIFLDESLTPLRLFGILLIMSGPLFMLKDRQRRSAAGNNSTFDPDYRTGILFSLLSALGFGVSPILIRHSLEDSGVWGGVAGGLIAYLGGGAIIWLAVLFTGKVRHVFTLDRNTAKWFCLSGVFVTVSQMLRFMALAVAPVSIVSPIQQTSNIFQMLFAWLINRQHEAFGPWVIAGIIFSMLGAICVSISLEPILNALDLPPDLHRVLSWRWP